MNPKTAAFFLAAFATLTSSCEQHKWDETKKLFNEGEHGGASADHAKTEPHGEKKAEEAKH